MQRPAWQRSPYATELGDVSRIKIKNHDVLVPETVGIIYGDTLKLAIHALAGQRNCFFKDIFL